MHPRVLVMLSAQINCNRYTYVHLRPAYCKPGTKPGGRRCSRTSTASPCRQLCRGPAHNEHAQIKSCICMWLRLVHGRSCLICARQVNGIATAGYQLKQIVGFIQASGSKPVVFTVQSTSRQAHDANAQARAAQHAFAQAPRGQQGVSSLQQMVAPPPSAANPQPTPRGGSLQAQAAYAEAYANAMAKAGRRAPQAAAAVPAQGNAVDENPYGLSPNRRASVAGGAYQTSCTEWGRHARAPCTPRVQVAATCTCN